MRHYTSDVRVFERAWRADEVSRLVVRTARCGLTSRQEGLSSATEVRNSYFSKVAGLKTAHVHLRQLSIQLDSSYVIIRPVEATERYARARITPCLRIRLLSVLSEHEFLRMMASARSHQKHSMLRNRMTKLRIICSSWTRISPWHLSRSLSSSRRVVDQHTCLPLGRHRSVVVRTARQSPRTSVRPRERPSARNPDHPFRLWLDCNGSFPTFIRTSPIRQRSSLGRVCRALCRLGLGRSSSQRPIRS